MNNYEKIKLDNGLKIYLLNDNTKHTTYINLIVNYGGLDNCININNKKHTFNNGMAHFIEHLVLESSIYGDLMETFGKMGIISNGLTSVNRTQFYIDTVDHIYDGLDILIKGIHNPIINKDIIESIKRPILEEKRRSLDNKYSLLYNVSLTSILDNSRFNSILGDLKEIGRINEKSVKLAFNSMYRPENEIIVIGGRFDRETILNTINSAYNSLKFNNNKIDKIIFKHNKEVNKKKNIIKTNIGLDRGLVTIKLDTKEQTPFDKLNLDMFLSFFLRMNFGITSKLNKEMLDNNLITNGIIYSNFVVEGYHYIRIESDSNDTNKFINRIIDYFKNKEFIYDEELFQLYKKNIIINLITRNDSIYDVVEPFIENLITFNYEGLDNVSDIEDLTFDDYKNSINNLDFSNYSITTLKNE